MAEGEIFNLQEGERLKEEGMAEAKAARKEIYLKAVQIAKDFASGNMERVCTIDDVQNVLISQGYNPKQLGPAAGSVFRGKCWEEIGHKNSARPSNHAARISVWRLK